jgi:uracil-DNA glycosylase
MIEVSELSTQELLEVTMSRIKGQLVDAVQNHMDVVASSRGYDSLLSACTYAPSTNLPYAAEGKACLEWRDAVWDYCYQVMTEVESGVRSIPTCAELIDSLPHISW